MYILLFIISGLLTYLLTRVIIALAWHWDFLDRPDPLRKKHAKITPLGGGVSIFLSFFLIIFLLFLFGLLPETLVKPIFWIFVGSCILMLGGVLDDRFNFSPKIQIIFPLLAVFIVLFGGIRIGVITNPQGGVFIIGGMFSLALTFIWLLSITYTTKILDGLDGLVSGIMVIAGFSIFLFTTITKFREPNLSLVFIVLMGAFFGFLFLNKFPAKIFLGEGGSLFAGFLLGSLAILTGAKIAVTVMVLALPLIDLVAVVLKRATLLRKSIFSGDRLHLHFILIDRGWNPKMVVYFFWFLSAVLGVVSIFLLSWSKVVFLLFVALILFVADIFYFKN